MKRPQRGPNPFAEFFVFVALVGALYMAVEGLVYEAVLVRNLPAHADLSWSGAWSALTAPDIQASPAAQRTYGK